jgi:superfamily II DNA/RNA helicase
MSNSFHKLGLPDQLVEALTSRDFTHPFPVQSAAIPPALTGRDIQGKAPTGSGKTLAFGLPLLARVERSEGKRPRALVLAPTRELAEQIKSDLAPLAGAVGRRVGSVYGGVGYGPQLAMLRAGVDVLVATPGRLLDLIQRRSVDLARVAMVVIDEADRMADMGFLPDVRRILDQTTSRSQTLLFSATLDGDIAGLSKRYQRDPVLVEAGPKDESPLDVAHHFWRVAKADRTSQTAELVRSSRRSIVFTRTRHGADRLVKQLSRADVAAVAMHGGRSQNQRTRALEAFSSGKAQALVATDVAARGIHVEDVAAVVHYDVAADPKDYLHRSGRTARAGATGVVVTLVSEGQDPAVRRIIRDLGIDARIESPSVIGQATPRSGSAPRVEKGNGDDPHMSHDREKRSLYVGNLPWKTTARDLEELFSGHGRVERASISRHAKTGRSKGFGFVDIVERQLGTASALDGATLGGRVLRVRAAR